MAERLHGSNDTRIALNGHLDILGEHAYETMACIAVGLAAGVPLALAAASSIRSHLFGIEPHDPAALVMACAIVVLAAGRAAYLPARRALRVDPSAVLRLD